MLKILLAGAIGLPVAATATVAATGVAWVDVREGGKEGQRIVLPVPLILADVASAFVPDKQIQMNMGEARQYLPLAREMMEVLRDCPDAELVKVEEGDEEVTIAKSGDVLKIRVHTPGENVAVNVPLSALTEIIDENGNLSTSRAVRVLRHARFSTLVEVEGRNEHVKISVW
jgi:hypothetical protein